MTTLYPSPIFGPVHSRRLGVSLGINLMPADGKLCSFDCIYCECGLNADHRPTLPRPTRQEVADSLTEVLKTRHEAEEPLDVITFAGNGEPTLHPDFPAIIDDTIRLRNIYFPEAKVSVLSNATAIHKKTIREALLKVDNNIQKLDTICEDYIRLVDRPAPSYSVQNTVENLCKFHGKVIIQTMFMTGSRSGVDNTSEEFIQPWLEALQKIEPEMVMIYTIDRETPVDGLSKASPDILDAIAERVRNTGINVSVSY